MLETQIHQLERVGVRAIRESEPAKECVDREACRQRRHQYSAHVELSDHRQQSAGRQEYELPNPLRYGDRVVESQPATKGHAHESNAIEMQCVQGRCQPRYEICPVAYRLVGAALSRLTHDIDGIYAMVLTERGDVR